MNKEEFQYTFQFLLCFKIKKFMEWRKIFFNPHLKSLTKTVSDLYPGRDICTHSWKLVSFFSLLILLTIHNITFIA